MRYILGQSYKSRYNTVFCYKKGYIMLQKGVFIFYNRSDGSDGSERSDRSERSDGSDGEVGWVGEVGQVGEVGEVG